MFVTQATGSVENLLCLCLDVCNTGNRVCADSSEVSCQETYDFVDLCLNTNKKNLHLFA